MMQKKTTKKRLLRFKKAAKFTDFARHIELMEKAHEALINIVDKKLAKLDEKQAQIFDKLKRGSLEKKHLLDYLRLAYDANLIVIRAQTQRLIQINYILEHPEFLQLLTPARRKELEELKGRVIKIRQRAAENTRKGREAQEAIGRLPFKTRDEKEKAMRIVVALYMQPLWSKERH